MPSLKPGLTLREDHTESERAVWVTMVRSFKGVPIRISCTQCGVRFAFYMPKGPGKPRHCTQCGNRGPEGLLIEEVEMKGVSV